jgi:hypothetical protein
MISKRWSRNSRSGTATDWVLNAVASPHSAGLVSYQPHSRFWAFQFIEGGWLLAAALLLGAATVWLVRRRAQ